MSQQPGQRFERQLAHAKAILSHTRETAVHVFQKHINESDILGHAQTHFQETGDDERRVTDDYIRFVLKKPV